MSYLTATLTYLRIFAPAWLGITVFLATGNVWLTATAQVLSLLIAGTVGMLGRR